MAWSSAALSAQETTDFAADLPILIGTNPGDNVADARWNATGSLADADTSASGYPAAAGIDRKGNELTKPSSAGTTRYWMADLGATPPDIDCAILFSHNLGAIGSGTVALQFADDAAFTVNLITVGTFNPNPDTDTRRAVLFSLFHTGAVPLRYSLARYVRLVFTFGSSQTPQFGEIWLGRRRQLSAAALLSGYDNEEEESGAEEFEADDGNVRLYALSPRRRVVSAQFKLGTGNSGEAGVVKSWWSDCKGASKPCVIVLQPSSAPQDTAMLVTASRRLARPILALPSSSWSKRDWSVQFREADTFLANDT